MDTPTEYEIGPVRVVGADNFDQQAIKEVAGLRQGQKITIPGDQLSKAIRNLWEEELFSDISIVLDKEVKGIVTYQYILKRGRNSLILNLKAFLNVRLIS